jgi:hypothetical protein
MQMKKGVKDAGLMRDETIGEELADGVGRGERPVGQWRPSGTSLNAT